LVPYQAEIGTAITIVLVGVILSTYLLVLKRNGWISKAAIETSPTENTFQNKPELKTLKRAPIIKPDPIIIEDKVTLSQKDSKQPKTSEPKPTAEKNEVKSDEKLSNERASDIKKDNPDGCNHYFGYLGSLLKGTATPEECYCCLKLIDCFKEHHINLGHDRCDYTISS